MSALQPKSPGGDLKNLNSREPIVSDAQRLLTNNLASLRGKLEVNTATLEEVGALKRALKEKLKALRELPKSESDEDLENLIEKVSEGIAFLTETETALNTKAEKSQGSGSTASKTATATLGLNKSEVSTKPEGEHSIEWGFLLLIEDPSKRDLIRDYATEEEKGKLQAILLSAAQADNEFGKKVDEIAQRYAQRISEENLSLSSRARERKVAEDKVAEDRERRSGEWEFLQLIEDPSKRDLIRDYATEEEKRELEIAALVAARIANKFEAELGDVARNCAQRKESSSFTARKGKLTEAARPQEEPKPAIGGGGAKQPRRAKQPKQKSEAGKSTEGTELAEQIEALRQEIEQLRQELASLKEQNQKLKEENQQLKEENKILQEKQRSASSAEARIFVDFWVNHLLSTDYLISRLAVPGYGFATIDRGSLTWRLPDLVYSRLSAAYGADFDPRLAHQVYSGIMDRILAVGYQPSMLVGYPPVPNIQNIVAGRDINIGNVDLRGVEDGGVLPQTGVNAVQAQSQARAAESDQQPSVAGPNEPPKEESRRATALEQTPETDAESARPQDSVIAGALESLIHKYAIEDAGRGLVRGGVLPVAGAIAGGTSFSLAMGLAGLSGPIVGAASVALGSLIGSRIRRRAGENAFSLWARYSHVEKEGGIWGGIKTAFRYFTRGLERQTIKKILGLEGRSEKIQELVSWFDTALPSQKKRELQNNPEELKHYLTEALWYVAAVDAVQRTGGYLHQNERREWMSQALKVSGEIDLILRSLGYKPGQGDTDSLLEEAIKEIEERESSRYGAATAALAGLGAAKALVGAKIIDLVRDEVHHFLSGRLASAPVQPAGPVLPTAPAAETVYPGGDSFGELFQKVTGLSADHLWSDFHGEAVFDKFFAPNIDNQDYWRYLAGLAKGGYLDNLNEVREIGRILAKLGIDAAKGDFTPDPSMLTGLTHQEQLTLVRYVGYPGWAQKILGHPLSLRFPAKDEFMSVITSAPY